MSTAPRFDANVTTILCDADGTLFPSEEPAFVASAAVTRTLAEQHGLAGDFTPDGLRRASTGQNFRAATIALLDAAGITCSADELEDWVQQEKDAVTKHLAEALTVDADVVSAVRTWAGRYRLAAVSSSAQSRLTACFVATGLDEYFPPQRRFSAEDSLPEPISKPDPAIYLHALRELGCRADEAVAIEDSTSGVRAAVAAGLATVGIVQFAPADERAALRGELRSAGAQAVAEDWTQLAGWL